MMGSTSAALNALATSFTKDFYLPYLNRNATDRQAVFAARMATAVFGLLMVAVATAAAYSVLKNPHLTIIPIAIGILGYTYGALLGVFLLGMLTRSRGKDSMNLIAMVLGMAAVLILGKVELPKPGTHAEDVVLQESAVTERVQLLAQEKPELASDAAKLRTTAEDELKKEATTIRFGAFMPRWWPAVSWPWFVLLGCSVTFLFGVLFRTPQEQIQSAEDHVKRGPTPEDANPRFGHDIL